MIKFLKDLFRKKNSSPYIIRVTTSEANGPSGAGGQSKRKSGIKLNLPLLGRTTNEEVRRPE